MKVLQKIALGLLLAWTGSSLPAAAQDDFDPMPPPEPYMRYKVKVGVNEPGIAYSSGAGTYTVGSSVWINTSSYSTSYTFSHWLKNGVVYSTERGFYYTVDATVEFVAVYDFTPIVPDDPSGIYPRKLYLESSMEDACSFNRTSGAKVNANSYVNVRVYPNTGFEFKGWYENGKLVSENISFYYLMGNADVTLTAMFEFNPATPDDPNMADDQGEVDNRNVGDVNGDGTVDISDYIGVANHILGIPQTGFNADAADVNGDGIIDISDYIGVANIILTGKP